ncbi:PWWP domain-containing protein [Plasmodiophora brassicae]
MASAPSATATRSPSSAGEVEMDVDHEPVQAHMSMTEVLRRPMPVSATTTTTAEAEAEAAPGGEPSVQTEEERPGFIQDGLPDGLDFGSLIFFKLKGQAYWPGRISGKHIASPDIVATFTGRGILVFSFGNHDYEMVQKDAIMPYQEYLDKCQRPKRTWSKAFRHAMREAQMIESGELVIDESTLILDDTEPQTGKRSRSSLSALDNEETVRLRKSLFRRKILRSLGLFPPEVLMTDYGMA